MTGVTKATSSPYFGSFLKGMRDLNYIEGRDFEMMYRFSDGYADRLPVIGEEIVRAKPDVIVAAAVDAVVAVRKYTSTIPIVSFALADAVHLGLIKSEARPEGNITGIQPYLKGLPAKQLELALEIVPHATKVGLLTNLQDPKARLRRRSFKLRPKVSSSTSLLRTLVNQKKSNTHFKQYRVRKSMLSSCCKPQCYFQEGIKLRRPP